jgi:hypothetical protein
MKRLTVKKGSPDPKARQGPRTLTGALRRADFYRWLERGAPTVDEVKEWDELENKWRENILPDNND